MRKLGLITALTFMAFININAQSYLTKTGYASFFSTTPVEDIKAENYKVTSRLDIDNGEVVFSIPIQSFEFEKALMQKHFNQKQFMDSKSYPKAKFKGTILNITSLDLSQVGEAIQVLVVSSASAGEGKTTVATSLTASIAGATKKPTLIIDADLRSPDVADVLKIEEGPGLGEFLAGECQLNEAIHRVGDGDTYVMPAGQLKKNPHHLVQMQQVSQLLDSLREQFSNIVIDTSPVLGASESLVFAKAADAVLYCSLSGLSRARQVRVAIDRLRHAGCNIAGSVLSGTPASRYAYVYGYYPEQSVIDDD